MKDQIRCVVDIDLMVRTSGDLTYSSFEDVRGSIPAAGDPVLVREPGSGAHGFGTVVEVDRTDKMVYLDVDWGSLDG